MVTIGNQMLRGKPNDIRKILENPMVQAIDGEEQGKFFRFAIEVAKIDRHLEGNYSKLNLSKLDDYKMAMAIEQDASSSGAQIIALTTRNKQLAELSNVVPTNQKKRLYDEIARDTFNDPRFKRLNEKLGLNEKDLRKAAKAKIMVALYGAGARTGVMNVEGKLSKILGKADDVLVVTATDREKVLADISARIARFDKVDPEITLELRALRQNVKDVFNKGVSPSQEIMEQLWFLDPKTRELVEKMSHSYGKVITPEDFRQIAVIMTEYMEERTPILKSFTRFFGRLAEDFLANAKPSKSAFDWKTVGELAFFGEKRDRVKVAGNTTLGKLLGINSTETKTISIKAFERLGFEKNGTLYKLLFGADAATTRRTGAKFFKYDIIPELKDTGGIEVFTANKLPKSWTNVPFVNFDGKVLEQNYSQIFEERLRYKDKNGNWVTNIVQVPQKTEATWWEQLVNASGKIDDIADATKARTAYGVNANHSNDAVIVKRFHLWGSDNKIPTSTIHDAFFTNAADSLKAKQALREIYADVMERNVIQETLTEMRNRGLPNDLYNQYRNEAIDIGLIPVPGRSKIDGKTLTDKDILKAKDILEDLILDDFSNDRNWYGIGG